MPSISKDAIILELKASSKEAVLRELAALAAVQCGRFTEEAIYRALLAREALGSTGIGHGLAIPHAKLEGLDEILLCFGRSKTGIAFDAADSLPVFTFVLFLTPADLAAEYLRVLADLTTLLKKREIRHRLQYSTSPEEIAEHLGTVFALKPL